MQGSLLTPLLIDSRYVDHTRTDSVFATADDSKLCRGVLAATDVGLEWSEKCFDGNGGEVSDRLYLTGDNTAGKGAAAISGITVTFGYNADHYCRFVTGSDRCFSRAYSDLTTTVWRYGLYDASGAQYDLAKPAFEIVDASGEYGIASYNGIWLPDTPAHGWPSPISMWGTVDAKTFGSTTFPADTTYEVIWNGVDKFKIAAAWINGMRRRIAGQFQTAAELAEWTKDEAYEPGVQGWSSSMGSEVLVDYTCLTDASPGTYADCVTYVKEELVYPGDASVPTSLKCVMDCPTRPQRWTPCPTPPRPSRRRRRT